MITKKAICVFLFIGCCTFARAQVIIALLFGDKLNSDEVEFGLVISPTITNITGTGGKPKTELNLGLYFNIKITDNLYLHPEVTVKGSFGAKDLPVYATGSDSLDNLFATGTVQRNIRAICLPMTLRFRIHKLLFGQAGIQCDWLLNAKDVFKAEVNGNDLRYTIKLEDELPLFDIGLTAGLEYKLKKDKGMSLGVRYYYGGTDILDTPDGTQMNTAWVFNIHIPIGAGKSAGRQ